MATILVPLAGAMALVGGVCILAGYNARWGAWLHQGQICMTTGRILVQELTERLPGSTVFAENSAITVTADATIAINVQRLDTDSSGAVILLAQVAITGRNAAARSIRLSVMPPSPGTSGLVSAMSTATAQLADIAAGMVAGR